MLHLYLTCNIQIPYLIIVHYNKHNGSVPLPKSTVTVVMISDGNTMVFYDYHEKNPGDAFLTPFCLCYVS